jgi:hypothetical protein
MTIGRILCKAIANPHESPTILYLPVQTLWPQWARYILRDPQEGIRQISGFNYLFSTRFGVVPVALKDPTQGLLERFLC